ncbi:5-formyltetrahydrofolate cyclo-ligase [Gluconobacter morbifer]|uniref:5-formyltetrahydrofolate cyclo-ligase n=1 Tax=Gluconobacter morbifer G707 TaxID=1088869 RepID=G6XKN4_9PROT|nr:5-formyltetrahydrofolate cyclo-ligase [Gluconobacter morbifer]EHH67597.1 5-formyltetrahydrofolate cyclo-ligase [Gluconobacter morbifer G707]
MAAPQISPLDQQKKDLRRRFAQERHRLTPDEQERLSGRLLDAVLQTKYQVIAAVWPLPGEVDLRPFCHRLHASGRQVALPETPPRGNPLIFRQWTPETILFEGRFGTQYPDGGLIKPDLVLVPFLAFDRQGFRLGYGGGYYDRTLAQLHVPAIGFGYSGQEVKEIPVGSYDVPLSVIVTEQETIRIKHEKMKD